MAVLIEGISVVFPSLLLKTKYEGGWERFREDLPAAVVVTDGELYNISFFPTEDAMTKVGDYLNLLEKRGLTVADNQGNFVDVAIIDQLQNYPEGFDCDWLTIYKAIVNLPQPKPEKFVQDDPNAPQEETPEEEEEAGPLTDEELEKLPRVKACRLNDGKAQGVSLPPQWDYEKSLTKEFGIEKPEEPFVPDETQ